LADTTAIRPKFNAFIDERKAEINKYKETHGNINTDNVISLYFYPNDNS
jgi:hypothetical protein